jgi:hypothetical protein
MKHIKLNKLVVALSLAGMALPALAYNSGSTGADGAFNPTVNTEVQVPASGVFNYTTVNIPTGVTVTYKKNTTNTSLVILASGNVTISGAIDVSGKASTAVGAAGDGNVGDDGLPGAGGVGGYDGGRGGLVLQRAGSGLGAGAGGGGNYVYEANYGRYFCNGGGGGGFGGAGNTNYSAQSGSTGIGGSVYGSAELLPLLGGSGGGGGCGGDTFGGSGGGGGGGAVLIASSGTLNVAGGLYANGNVSGPSAGGTIFGASGGGGSGGGIRLIATTLSGNGTINAVGGGVGTVNGTTGWINSGNVYTTIGGNGGAGRIRLEAETMTRTAATNPAYSFGAPGSITVSGLPTLIIASVAGVAAPASPTGSADITLPSTTANPVTVAFSTTGVPAGNTVTLKVTPAYGATTTATSSAITSSGTASVTVTLPTGTSVLSATTTYTVVVAMGDALSIYAQGERVEKVRLTTTMNGPTLATLITVSGKEFTVPHAALATIVG